jgi:hypothetical protein
MPAPIIPWQPSNIPTEIQNELNRRKVNRSFNYINSAKVGTWDKTTGDWNKYKGPMTAWVRMCSNGAGHPATKKERFVLHGGKDFYTSYGYQQNTNQGRHQIIGWTPGDIGGQPPEPHIIDTALTKNYPIGVPSPEITRIEVTVQKELYRRAKVEWICFSWEQLQYMTPYFLIPRITVMMEWGWNLFNPTSLVNIANKNEMRNLFNNPYPLYTDNIIRSNGNYDVIYGFITNFDWSVEGNKIIVSTEITSKDRLYSGIAIDSTLHSKADNNWDGTIPTGAGALQSVKQFLDEGNTLKNLVGMAEKSLKDMEVSLTKTQNSAPLLGIVQELLELEAKVSATDEPEEYFKLSEKQDLKTSYLYGVFAGREGKGSKAEKWIGPRPTNNNDWDSAGNTTAENTWLNMGLIVEILNYFSKRQGVGNDAMFEVEIFYSVITGHPNLISCDRRVLIPNYQAPKFHYGLIGQDKIPYNPLKKDDWYKQDVEDLDTITKADKKLYRTFYQGNEGMNKCYRNNLEKIINVNRYIAKGRQPKEVTTALYSFPAAYRKEFHGGQIVEKDFSGLLSNIYFSLAEFKKIVTDAKTYVAVYDAIFAVLKGASGNLWDLSLIENQQGKLTIADKNYSGPANFKKSSEVYDFSYYDADSIIKSLKFRPQLSDAQATRAIYSNTNNQDSKFSYSDRNDLLDYKFRDAVILPADESISPDVAGTKEKQMQNELKGILSGIQVINNPKDDSLQMTIAGTIKLEKRNVTVITQRSGGNPAGAARVTSTKMVPVPDTFEIVKLVLPSSPLLGMILNDEDFDNNPRYCAIQPGITAELTLEGIGGLRTFQYFRIRNLPEPYSHRNIIFRIVDVVQSINGGIWETTIKAGILPLRKYIIKQLGIKDIDLRRVDTDNISIIDSPVNPADNRSQVQR